MKIDVRWYFMDLATPENLKGAEAALLFSPSMANDEDYPGHPYIVSNLDYILNGNAERDGYTMWYPITKPPFKFGTYDK